MTQKQYILQSSPLPVTAVVVETGEGSAYWELAAVYLNRHAGLISIDITGFCDKYGAMPAILQEIEDQRSKEV